MKLQVKSVPIDTLSKELALWMKAPDRRFGLLTSLDGDEILILLLDPRASSVELWQSAVLHNSYTSLTLSFAQLHWFERVLWNLFGIVPTGHPRLKPVVLHDEYAPEFFPLRKVPVSEDDHRLAHNPLQFLEVHGEGVWELPVGPIHAGVIEPGHFRFSCLGETILNLELRLGYVHRGVEQLMTQVPWRKARFAAEAAASDTAAANALAHAIALESLLEVEVPHQAQVLRSIALECERAAMHVADVGGMMTDIGLVSMAATMSRLRGIALNFGQALSGSRFLRGFILPGGVARLPHKDDIALMKRLIVELRTKLLPVLTMFRENQAALARMDGVGRIKRSLAEDFGLVGVAARACGVEYDTRRWFSQGVFPDQAPPVVVETGGDIRARIAVRINEIRASIAVIEQLLSILPGGPVCVALPERLPVNQFSVGIVEAFRGELIHLCATNSEGHINRYAIKDPSFNNWTAIPIAVRDNLIADFPLCNKSLSLSYSGNDL